MPRSSATLEQLFDQTWRPGRPLRPRLSSLRRWGMFSLLCFLLSVIAAYWYLTDAVRVQRMCETYLSRLTGGHVEVRHAALSIFEGLRLEGVSIHVDRSGALDSGIFDVQTLLLKYNPESILNGKLEATEIVAIDPRVSLCENLDATPSRWNYERLKPPRPPATSQPNDQKPILLPQIKLRNGQVHYSQLQGGKLTSLGTIAIDGSLSPGETLGTCLFRMQSRVDGGAVATNTLGPVVRGEAIPATGEVGAQLENFTFGPGIKSMLPEVVRRFMEDHQLAGHVDVMLHVKPNLRGGKPEFRVEMNLNKVALAVSPNDWLSSAERRQIDTLHGAFALMRVAGMNADAEGSGGGVQGSGNANDGALNPEVRPANPSKGFVDHLERTITPSLIRLEKVDGKFIFTQDGIEIQGLNGRVEHNSFQISGHIEGYAADAPAKLEVVGEDLYIPHTPRYANAMPRVVRQIYEALHPEGSGRLTVRLLRTETGKTPIISGELEVDEGQFLVDEFPYPLRNVTGKITFGPDVERGTRLDLVNLRAHGVRGGPNEHNTVVINGLISPIDGDAEMNVNVVGEHILSEPAIRNALPKEGKEALRTLDPSGKGDYPTFKANIAANIHRAAGPYKPFTVTLTLDLEDGAGAFEGFAYPLQHMTGRVVIGDGYVHLINCMAKKDDATVSIDGALTFGKNKPLTPDITLVARNAPIDKTLLAAISPDRREWLEKLGVSGKLDVDGKIFLKPATQPAEVEVALDMKVHDGALWPRDSTFAVSDLSGRLRLADDHITFADFKGKRGDGSLLAGGSVRWANHRPELSVAASAKNLLLEPALYQLLPKDAQAAWDAVHPEGTVDVALEFGAEATKQLSDKATKGGSVDAPPTSQPTTAPVLASATGATVAVPYHLSLTPSKLAATLSTLPYKLTDLSGRIIVTPEGTTIENVMGKHKGASIAISGTGANNSSQGGLGDFNLKLMGRDVPVDDELLKALPVGFSDLLKSMNLHGKLAFDLQQVDYHPVPPRADGKPVDGDLALGGTLWFSGATMELGMPVTDADGLLKFETAMHAGKLGGFKGKLQGSEMKIANRVAKDFSAELFKPENQDAMRLDKVQGSLAGGEIAGQMDLAFPDNAASRFAIGLVLRNADVTQLTGEKDIHGQVTASFALEGAWNDPTTRRGRGDVTVAGRDMYHIPLMLGLMQITNLSLPISSPFNEGNTRYSIEGQKITFEQIELRASNMIMQGSGSMNFDTKKVKMSFVTDNPNWPKLPIVNDLIQGAKHELLQIHVSGTIEQPKVSGSLMSTFTTTIDEVLRGGKGEKDKK